MGYPETKEEFKAHVAKIESRNGYRRPYAFAFGFLKYEDMTRQKFDINYHQVNIESAYGTAAIVLAVAKWLRRKLITDRAASHELYPTQVRAILRHFDAFDGERGHANIDALESIDKYWHRATFFMRENAQIPVVVMVLDEHTPSADPIIQHFRDHLLKMKAAH